MKDYLFTSESVTEGHPDKVCDAIADAILDDIIRKDPDSHVAIEVLATTGLVVVSGEVKCECYSDMNGIARSTIQKIGYHSPAFGFDGATCGVFVSVDEQSSDIDAAVLESEEVRLGIAEDDFDRQGAGDQGMMFGYACTESERFAPGAYMPLPIFLAHRLAQRLAQVRKDKTIDFIGPDGKTQVTVRYRDGVPVCVERVLIAVQHLEGVPEDKLKQAVMEEIVGPVIPRELYPTEGLGGDRVLVNPSGKFVKGGPLADTGLTGRKIIVDTYGGCAHHGGGSFSGKDPSKVDRSASYYARYAALNLVAAGVADRLELEVAYAIGRARPVSIAVNSFDTERVPTRRIEQFLESREVFDFRPAAIIDRLGLKAPVYRQVAAYGHFGRTDLDLSWERPELADQVKQALM